MRGTRGQLTRRGLVVAVVVVLVGGAVFGGAVFGFGLGGSGDTGPGTPTVEPGTVVPSPTPTATVTPTLSETMTPTATVVPKPTPTPTVVATPFPVPSETATPTPEPTSKSDLYEEFLNTFLGEMAHESDVPIRARGGAIIDGEWWIIVNMTDPAITDNHRDEERGGLVTGYIRAYQFYYEEDMDGKLPTGMRVLEVNNTGQPPKTFFVSNLLAERVKSDNIGGPELVDTYYSTLRNQTDREKELVIENDKQGTNVTYGPDGNVNLTDS
jgi:hypothetical protein